MSVKDWVFLVETSAVRLADGAEFPLYLAKPGTVKFPHACYLGQVAELPRLTRQADSSTEPKRVPTWGELRLAIRPDYRPDADNSVSWSEILSPAFNLLHRPLVIKAALKGAAYDAFDIIFRGRISETGPWADGGVTLSLRDKSKDLERVISDYVLPESPLVIEDAWGTEMDQALGYVRNVTPKLFATPSLYQAPWFPPLVAPEANYQNRWALSTAVINRIVQIYIQGGVADPGLFTLVQKDVSPAEKNGEGTAEMATYGPYTGPLSAAKWLVVISSITALNSQGHSGPEVGLARFRVSRNEGLTWSPDYLTWMLGYDSTTLVKSPAAGNAGVAVTGDFTGDCKDNYKLKVTRGGHIGDAICPQFIWSPDGGATWLPDDVCTWNPIAAAPGVMSVTAHNHGDTVAVEITTGGNVGGDVRFRWSRDGRATWTTNVQIPSTAPIELFAGYSVQFTAPGEVGVDDYDAGDAGGSTSAVDILPTDPATLESLPIPLDRGLVATFTGEGGTGVYTPTWTWTPVGSAPGTCMVTYGNEIDLGVTITGAGDVGTATFHWIYKEGGVDEAFGDGVTSAAEQVVYEGLKVTFYGADDPLTNDFDVGDRSVISYPYTPPFVAGDMWTFSFKEIPIPLGEEVMVQFSKGNRTGPAFELDDEFGFILIATLNSVSYMEDGDLTCDLEGLISPLTEAYEDRPGALIAGLVTANAGWTEADLHLPSLEGFDTAMPYQLGLMAKSGQTIAEVINELLVGFPAFYTILLDDRFYLVEITPPAGAPEFILTNRDILEMEHQQLAADLVWRVLLRYGRNWTVTQNALAGATPERMAWLRQEWRQISARDRTILQAFPWANDRGPLDTALTELVDAKALTRKNLALYGVLREKQRYEIKDPAVFRLNLGVTSQVRRPRFGLDAGALFRLMGLDIDLAGQASAELWR